MRIKAIHLATVALAVAGVVQLIRVLSGEGDIWAITALVCFLLAVVMGVVQVYQEPRS